MHVKLHTFKVNVYSVLPTLRSSAVWFGCNGWFKNLYHNSAL